MTISMLKHSLLQLFWFVLVAGTLFALAQFRRWFFPILGGVIVLAIIFWILGCVFSPARPDRRCPRCGKEGLVKLKRGEPAGVRCEVCGFIDKEKYVAYLDEW